MTALTRIEGRILDRNSIALGDYYEDAERKEDAREGSAMLRDAILRVKGHHVPAKPRATRRYDYCEVCGSEPKSPPTPIGDIKAMVSAYYDLSPNAMQSARRSVEISHPRQIAMYLASELTLKSLPAIAREFKRDHTTVFYAIRAVKLRMETNADVAIDVGILRERLSADLDAMAA